MNAGFCARSTPHRKIKRPPGGIPISNAHRGGTGSGGLLIPMPGQESSTILGHMQSHGL
jgi:hypothetical protein